MLKIFENVVFLGRCLNEKLLDRTGRSFLCFPYVEMEEVGLAVFCEGKVIHRSSFATQDGLEQFFRKTETEAISAAKSFMESGLAA
ncbi:MAG TPA: hypothetical protein VFC84_02180 [Desulfosporosinus sp.]|nr:hypothetical protein [Desulfosporosinus sp.]